MKTRLIVLTLVVLIALGLTASAAASGSPWPATVIRDPDFWCKGITIWPNADDTEWLDVPETVVVNILSGNDRVMAINCKGFVDFSDPKYMPFDVFCEHPFYGEFCKNGVVNTPFEVEWCEEDECAHSQTGRFIVTQSGEQHFTLVVVWKHSGR